MAFAEMSAEDAQKLIEVWWKLGRPKTIQEQFAELPKFELPETPQIPQRLITMHSIGPMRIEIPFGSIPFVSLFD
jgi:hypothetical protein